MPRDVVVEIPIPRGEMLPSEISRELKTLNIAELLTREFPPRSHVVVPWLPTQGLGMVYAPRGLGKTYFALCVAYGIACGGQFLTWQCPTPRKVLYIDGEMPGPAMQERLIAIVKAAPHEPPSPDYFTLLTPDLQEFGIPDLGDPAGQAALAPLTDAADFIVLDNLSTLCRTGGENKADDWLVMQEWLLRLRSKGKSVLLIHHAGKGGQQRGTSRREDVLDTVISLRHPSDYEPEQGARFEIHFEKARGCMGDDVQALEVQLFTGTNGLQSWNWQTVKASRYERIIELNNEGLSQRQIADEIGCGQATISRALHKAKREGRLNDSTGKRGGE